MKLLGVNTEKNLKFNGYALNIYNKGNIKLTILSGKLIILLVSI